MAPNWFSKPLARKKKLVLTASPPRSWQKHHVPSTKTPTRLGPTKKADELRGLQALDEFLVFSYWKEKKLPVIVVSLFISVGPRQTGRYGMVPPIRQVALDNTALTNLLPGSIPLLLRRARHVERLIRLMDLERSSANHQCRNTEKLPSRIGAASEGPHRQFPLPSSTSLRPAYEPGFEDMIPRPSVEKLHA